MKKTDKDKLQGRWEIVSVAVEGEVITRKDKPEVLDELDDVIIKGSRLRPTKADKLNSIWHGRFTLDESREPKQITIRDAGPDGKLTFRGIYTLDGDVFTLCINADGTDVCRPEEFVTRKGSTVSIFTFKRVPAKK